MRRLQADTDALSLTASDAAAVVDEHGVIRSLNPAHERLWGRSREAQIGRTIESVVTSRNVDMVRHSFDKALGGTPVRVRLERASADGTRVLDVSYQPVPDADGRVTRALFTARDMTDLLAVQRELERNVEHLRKANEGMQQFVRIASHDMREPLNTIAQFCGLIESDHAHELTPAARLYFEQVGGGARRMRTLLDDVLSFARLDDQADVALGAVALAGVANTALAALAGRIGACQAQVEVTKPLPTVLGHHSLLVLLLQNLVANGIKFAPAGQQPRVRISAREEAEFVVLTVADQGIGISAADQGQLFTPFKRLHTRRQYDGTGLGLAISMRIVERMAGTISLESQPGVGTQVHVRLPRPPAAA